MQIKASGGMSRVKSAQLRILPAAYRPAGLARVAQTSTTTPKARESVVTFMANWGAASTLRSRIVGRFSFESRPPWATKQSEASNSQEGE
jgi:hypothetical protein